MGKAPAFQFYPGDWFREPGLKRVGLSVRGAWAEFLMIMHDENPRGVISSHLEGFAQTLRTSPTEAAWIISELDQNKIAEVIYEDKESEKAITELSMIFWEQKTYVSPECPDVSRECPPSNTIFVTVKNRRMVKEENIKEYERLKKQRQRGRESVPDPVSPDVPDLSPPPSSSSTSSSPSKEEKRKRSFTSADVTFTEYFSNFAKGKGFDNGQGEELFSRFKDYSLANNKKYLDWDAAWRNWVNNEISFKGKPKKEAEKLW